MKRARTQEKRKATLAAKHPQATNNGSSEDEESEVEDCLDDLVHDKGRKKRQRTRY
jgi:hypothetical protein